MYILGINSAYHESAACLIKDGKIIAAIEEERFNRVKHAKPAKVDNPNELPINAIGFCLKKAGISLKDIEHVGYSLIPEHRLKKNIQHKHPYEAAQNDFGTKEGEEIFYKKNLEIENKIRAIGFKGKFHHLNHHDCHAASSFFVSPFKDAAVLVVDGIGEFESTTLYSGIGNKLKKLSTIDFPNSLGFLWEKISKYLGFRGYDAAKVMGLSSYGDPNVFNNQFRTLVKINPDGTFIIDDSIIQFRNEDYSKLKQLFSLEKRNEPVRNVNKQTKKYADLAAALQKITEEIVLKLAKSLKEKTGLNYLCLSGGVALNCVANGKLAGAKEFNDVFVQPAANDAGTAIGATYYIWNQLLNKPRVYVFESPYLGSSYSNREIKEVLDKNGLNYEFVDDIEQSAAELVAKGNVVALFQGAMEIGPRALGNRTILCDPRRKDAVALLNHKVKHREPFRPFCPSVLADKASEWFELNGSIPSQAKYMLGAFNVLDYRKSIIPAVTHVDGTSRIQAVEKEVNPSYYTLIKEFEALTGVPLVLNTSFNDREPIVCSPQDAVNTFLKTRIDYLAIGNYLVSRSENNEK